MMAGQTIQNLADFSSVHSSLSGVGWTEGTRGGDEWSIVDWDEAA
jgi:hypothetical protein